MNRTRAPAVAGMFYPDDAASLQRMVHEFLDQAHTATEAPKALIVPHAGYVYSGPIAAAAYASLRAVADRIHRVVLLGPAHRLAFRGLATSGALHFATPLGVVPLDRSTIDALLALPQVVDLEQAHALEHSLEVQLPFLQEVLGEFSLVPLVVGDANAEEVAEVLERLWGEEETLIVVSSDLSHYHDYATARSMDAATSTAIERLQPELIRHEQACGRNPVNGLLTVARRKGLHVDVLDVRNSGDTAGSRDQVVGYGAYAFH